MIFMDQGTSISKGKSFAHLSLELIFVDIFMGGFGRRCMFKYFPVALKGFHVLVFLDLFEIRKQVH